MSLQLTDMPTFSPSLIATLDSFIFPSLSHCLCIFYLLMESEGLSAAEGCGSFERTVGIGIISAVHHLSLCGSLTCKTPPILILVLLRFCENIFPLYPRVYLYVFRRRVYIVLMQLQINE